MISGSEKSIVVTTGSGAACCGLTLPVWLLFRLFVDFLGFSVASLLAKFSLLGFGGGAKAANSIWASGVTGTKA